MSFLHRATLLQRAAAVIVLAAALAAFFLLLWPRVSSGETTTTGARHVTIAGVTDNGTYTMDLPRGPGVCRFYGTWDGASVNMQATVPGTTDSYDVAVAALLTVIADTTWVSIDLIVDRYPITVTSAGASTDLTFYCGVRP